VVVTLPVFVVTVIDTGLAGLSNTCGCWWVAGCDVPAVLVISIHEFCMVVVVLMLIWEGKNGSVVCNSARFIIP